jgi:microcin C transport system permease protein
MSSAEVKRPFLSPLNQRRWQNFKANRRGYWSLWIFMILFILSLFTEFIANDKPIIASVDGKYVFPIFFHYSENDIVEPDDEFNLPTANFRDPFITEYVEENGWLLWPPIRYSYNTPNLEIPEPAPSKPSWLYDKETRCAQYENGVADANCNLGNMNWLGTDNQGRDVLARIIYGFRISVLFGLILTFASAVIGVSAGAVQGYFGGLTDLLFQRFIEIWSALPVLYLLLIISRSAD